MPKSNYLKSKLSRALKDEINTLPDELQADLIDDMITAFESRFAVLNKAKSNEDFAVKVALEIVHETLKS